MARGKTPRRPSGKRARVAPVAEKPQWLSRALARAGVLPLADAERAIRAGRVRIGGRAVREPLAPVPPGAEVRLDGKPVELRASTLVIAFHKPEGVISGHSDTQGRPTVFDLLHEALPRELGRYGWYAVGRLDRDTTGLMFFTNDARFVAHATSPQTHLPKRYVAKVFGKLDEAKLEPLRRGILLDDGPALPVRAAVRGPGVVELTLTEGRFHQVKRMLGAIGLPVSALHREAIGKVALDVPACTLRLLSEEEIRDGLGFREKGTGYFSEAQPEK